MYNIADKWFCRRWFIRGGSEVARGCFPLIVMIGTQIVRRLARLLAGSRATARCSAGGINHPRVQACPACCAVREAGSVHRRLQVAGSSKRPRRCHASRPGARCRQGGDRCRGELTPLRWQSGGDIRGRRAQRSRAASSPRSTARERRRSTQRCRRRSRRGDFTVVVAGGHVGRVRRVEAEDLVGAVGGLEFQIRWCRCSRRSHSCSRRSQTMTRSGRSDCRRRAAGR